MCYLSNRVFDLSSVFVVIDPYDGMMLEGVPSFIKSFIIKNVERAASTHGYEHGHVGCSSLFICFCSSFVYFVELATSYVSCVIFVLLNK